MTGKRPFFLPAGSELAAWLRSGPRSAAVPRTVLWTYRWRGYWFDNNWRRQEQLHPPRRFEGEAGHKLVFVMGFWRSGTTLLHELLASGPGMAAPRTWQCMNPSAFRIAGEPAAGVRATRPMDAVVVSALSPQEDEFALLARGAPSVYRAWLDPRRWEEALPALEQDTWLSLPASAWLSDWRTFLGWCMPEEAARLVIKSPNHVFRLRALQRLWPQARQVWTLRDPVDTWQSNRKMWRAMAERYGLWDGAAQDLDRLIFKALSEYAAALAWAPRTATWIDFDRLTNEPAGVLEELIERLGLGTWPNWRSRLEPLLAESAQRRPESYASAAALPAYAEPVVAYVRGLHRRLLEQMLPA